MANKIRIEYDAPCPESVEVAKNELRETPELVKQSLEELKELIKADPNLNFKLDDDFLLIFLRPCKFYPDSALNLMKRIADYKITYSNVLANLMPEQELETLCENNVVNVISTRDQNRRRILVMNMGKLWDTKNVSGDSLFRALYLIHLGAMLEPETQINGAIVILDFDGLGMAQVKQLTIPFSKRLLSFIQKALPIRMKQIHIVKQPFIFNVVWNIFKTFVEKKLNGRIYFHGNDMTKLHKYVEPEFLPGEYGGKLPMMDYSSKNWYPLLKSLDDRVAEWNTFGWLENAKK